MKTAPTIDSSRPARAGRHEMHGEQRHDDLEQVVVEGAEELRPEERLQPRSLQRVAIAVCHVAPVDFVPRAGDTIEAGRPAVLSGAEKR